MRKTKLIILPTKCLNKMGFLLLFLSCPVIGDWGRIRPESEMSQWSILIEREGTCGLVRDSSGIKKSVTPDGLMECFTADAELRNNTETVTEISQELSTDSLLHLESPIRDVQFERRNIRNSRVEIDAERRLRNARRESQESLSRRSVQAREMRTERRAVSLDRRSAFRYEDRRSERMQREMRYHERETRENRRMSRSLDRRVDARRELLQRRVRDTARRLSVSRQEREVSERRDTFETARRRIENARSIELARSGHSRNDRRVEERRVTRRLLQDERKDVRRDVVRREVRHETERRNSGEFRRMDRQERREKRRIAERRSFEAGMNRETAERRSLERAEGSLERRIRTSIAERDIRSARRNSSTDRRVRETAEMSRRREDGERTARFIVGRIAPDSRRIENDPSRKQEIRASIRHVDKPDERRNLISAGTREHREKSARVDYRIRYDKAEPLTMKSRPWEFLDGLKNWFGQKGAEEDWVSNHGDFATTCLVGAAVYFLTTRQVKTV